VAALVAHQGAQKVLSRGLPSRRVRLHYNSHIPIWADWIHGLLQGCVAERAQAATELEHRRGGEFVQVLQQGDPRSIICAAKLCAQGVAGIDNQGMSLRAEYMTG
jgi:hypothetical protein